MILKLSLPKPLTENKIYCRGIEIYLDGERQYGITETSPLLRKYLVNLKDGVATFEGEFKIVEVNETFVSNKSDIVYYSRKILTTAEDNGIYSSLISGDMLYDQT